MHYLILKFCNWKCVFEVLEIMKALEENSICYLCLCTQQKGHNIFLIFFQICSCKFAINSSQRFCNLLTMSFSSFVWICLYKLLLKAHKGMQNGFCKLIMVYIYFLLELVSIIVVNNSQGEQNGFTNLIIVSFSFLAWICLNYCY